MQHVVDKKWFKDQKYKWIQDSDKLLKESYERHFLELVQKPPYNISNFTVATQFAKTLTEKRNKLDPNGPCDERNHSHEVDEERKKLFVTKHEQVLMIRLPIKRKQRTLSEDDDARLSENESVMAAYFSPSLKESNVRHARMTNIEELLGCQCQEPRRVAEKVDQMQLENPPAENERSPDDIEEPLQPQGAVGQQPQVKEIHSFLHNDCSNTLLGTVIFNGHGGKDGTSIANGDPLKLDDLLIEIDTCYNEIAQRDIPLRVDIIFAQCYGHLCNKRLVNDNIEIISLTKPKNGFETTWSVYSEKDGKLVQNHWTLRSYMDDRKAEASEGNRATIKEENNATDTPSTRLFELSDNDTGASVQ